MQIEHKLRTVLLPFIILVLGLSLSAQNVTIDPNIKVDSTVLKISDFNYDYTAYSSVDNKKTDSLIVSISSVGHSTISVIIDLSKKPKVYVSLFSDYKEYDGKHILDIDAESYTLELNSTKFNIGDKIMARIKGRSKPVNRGKGEYQIKFEGEFRHIIGKFMIKKKAGQPYRIIDN